MSRDIYSVLTAPLITEKATLVNETGNQVIFRVRPEADKGSDQAGNRNTVQGKSRKGPYNPISRKTATRWKVRRTTICLEKSVCHPRRR